jgi:hypothetical protein
VVVDAFMTMTTDKLYNGKTPPPPPNADYSVFHETETAGDAPIVRSFTGTLEIGFTVTSTEKVNVNR